MESELLLARVSDTLNSCRLNNKPKFFGFLSLEESVLVDNFLKNRCDNYCFFGGTQDAQRVYLCCYPEWTDKPVFPIDALTFNFRKIDELSHRDFLGALMSLGLKRETVGDILIEKGRAVVFFSADVTEYVLKNISKVGRIGVTVTKGFDLPLPQTDKMLEKCVTVASLRLDCVVSAVANISRNSANEFIENGLVSVNSVVCQKPTKLISENDVLSVRHKGKFKILSCNGHTKKDRIVLQFNCF
ncbi:MAG: hypothetical protein E7537_02150 [Ruminococcaceae bacterium]|nr:hypothetical protein [Oscillospiraceae bacterium]